MKKFTPKDKIYYSVGKFTIDFENMINVLFETMVDFVDQQALTLDTDYIESLLCELEAMPLVTKFYNLYNIKYDSATKNTDLIRKIYLRLRLIIEFRNVLVHSSWSFSADADYIASLRKVFGNTRILEENLTSTKPKKKAIKHSRYLKSINLKMIKEYLKQIRNTQEILLKLRKYNPNDKTIIINSKRMELLTKEISRAENEDIQEIMKGY